jgi:hypothetical protein
MAFLTNLLLGLLSAAPVSDLYFEQTVVTRLNGQAEGSPTLARVWRSDRRLRIEQGVTGEPSVLILQLDTERAYGLDPARRTAHAIDLQWLRARSQLDLAAAGDLFDGAHSDARVTRLAGSRRIAGYECDGFRIRSGTAIIDVYVSEALPVGIEAFSELLEWSGAPNALGGVLSRVRELRGFPLETRSRFTILGDVIETVATVERLELGPIAPSLFEPPPEYTLVPFDVGPEPRPSAEDP